MGHNVNYDKKYRLLQQRLDRNITGAPESPVFMKILKLLFSPEQAELARKIPGQPVSLNALSKKRYVMKTCALDVVYAILPVNLMGLP
jgi:hypothetical protein